MTEINFKPISARLIIKKILKDEKTAGGIFIPDVIRDSYNKGELAMGKVVAVGPGTDERRHLPDGGMECKVGDTVGYRSNEGFTFKLGGQEYLSIYESKILVKFD